MGTELRILDWIQSMRTPVGDWLMLGASRLGNAGMVWIFLTLLLLLFPKTRRSGAILAAALLIDIIVCNGILKNMVGRIRPCDVNRSVALLVPRPDDYSFPSGHTAASFAAVSALYHSGAKKLWKAALPLAVLIAFSRMYLYVHYPTDILGGIVVGAAAGWAGYQLIRCWERRRRGGFREDAGTEQGTERVLRKGEDDGCCDHTGLPGTGRHIHHGGMEQCVEK